MSRRVNMTGWLAAAWLVIVLALVGCGGETASDVADSAETEDGVLVLPQLESADLADGPLRVVATTSIIGDVVAQVGGDAIALTTLMEAGQDPHSYEPSARDLTTVTEAHVVFVNGWDLEEGLADDLANIGETVPVLPISANITPLTFGEDDEHDHSDEEHSDKEHADEEHSDEEHSDEEHSDEEHADEEHADEEHADEKHSDEEHSDEEHADEEHSDEDHAEEKHDGDEHGHDHEHAGADPHVWFSVGNVTQWTNNVAQVLSALDPDNADSYEANAAAYLAELDELADYAADQLNQLPEERRYLVTNHDAFGYLARDYELSVLGTVIPAMSTMAEPSASDLADLIGEMQEHNVCTIFTETTVSDTLAQTVASELDNCADVQVVELYTGALGTAGSGADSYIGLFRSNIDAIAAGLGG